MSTLGYPARTYVRYYEGGGCFPNSCNLSSFLLFGRERLGLAFFLIKFNASKTKLWFQNSSRG